MSQGTINGTLAREAQKSNAHELYQVPTLVGPSWTVEQILYHVYTPSFKAWYECCCASGDPIDCGSCGPCPEFDSTEHTDTITSAWATMMAYDFDAPPATWWAGPAYKAINRIGYDVFDLGCAGQVYAWCPDDVPGDYCGAGAMDMAGFKDPTGDTATYLAGCAIGSNVYCPPSGYTGGTIILSRVRITGTASVCVSRRVGDFWGITYNYLSGFTASDCGLVVPDGSHHIELPRAGFDPTDAVTAWNTSPGLVTGFAAAVDWPWIGAIGSATPFRRSPCDDCACP